jgi:hypothetical protein
LDNCQRQDIKKSQDLTPQSVSSSLTNKLFSIEDIFPPSHELTQNIWTIHKKSALANDRFYFIGRRNVTGYSLSQGYLMRHHYLIFALDGPSKASTMRAGNKNTSSVQTNKPNIKKSINGPNGYLNKTNKSYSKDKFSGGKLYFNTEYYNMSNSKVPNKLIKNIRGRLPNSLCDVLLPLLRAELVDITGHISYDIGPVNTFEDVPISLHIHVSEYFFVLANESLSDISSDSCYIERNNEREYQYGALIEAANDLLIWLSEGESAVHTSRLHRQEVFELKI